MASLERLRQRGANRGRKALTVLAEEFRQKRIAVGLSQAQVAAAAGIARSTYTRVENASLPSLSIAAAARIAVVLGLDLSVRAYPGGNPLRDSAHGERLDRVLVHAAPPLRSQREVALPQRPDRPMEQRAWDANVTGRGKRTSMEMEMRVTDAQALERRIDLKRRDDPVDSFVLLLADTHHNRRVLRENPTFLSDLKRMTFRALTGLLAAGEHPPSGIVLV